MKMRENSLFGVFLKATGVGGVEEDAQKRGVAQHLLQTGKIVHGGAKGSSWAERQQMWASVEICP